jgi:hypothetical protein
MFGFSQSDPGPSPSLGLPPLPGPLVTHTTSCAGPQVWCYTDQASSSSCSSSPASPFEFQGAGEYSPMPRDKHCGTIRNGRAALEEQYHESHGDPHPRLCRSKALSLLISNSPPLPHSPPSLAFETDAAVSLNLPRVSHLNAGVMIMTTLMPVMIRAMMVVAA